MVWARGGLGGAIDAHRGVVAPLPADYSNTLELGTVLYTHYVYPFELAAVLLLVAIVAAIALTMRQRTGLKVQDIDRAGGGAARGPRAHRQDGRGEAHDDHRWPSC